MGDFDYHRRNTHVVKISGTAIGGNEPVVIQSMTNTSTSDIPGSLHQISELSKAGASLVRLTAQGQREIACLAEMKNSLTERGENVPLVADIHFNTAAAFSAAEVVDKVRINPGNFVDPGRVFKHIDYTDEEYSSQLKILKDKLIPFYELCRKRKVAVRVGVNHGSLSDRIMSRYGNTPEGMVESAMEFLRIARDTDFNDIVVSIKSSNTVTMVKTVRLLAKTMEKEGMTFPLHLGVTEAGEGEDGRIKSAIGIGTLLLEGIGDTIRVSLSENPINEIPVARHIAEYAASMANAPAIKGKFAAAYDNGSSKRRLTNAIGPVGGNRVPVVIVEAKGSETSSDAADFVDTASFHKIHLNDDTEAQVEALLKEHIAKPLLINTKHINRVGHIKAFIHSLEDAGIAIPVVVTLSYSEDLKPWEVAVRASMEFGALLIDGLIDGLLIDAPQLSPKENERLAFGILQGCRQRITRTEYIACPGCGRTLFDLGPTLANVKRATSHLKGLKIGVMGCIVNGPGEMADADYGYVGAGKGKISLYRGIECVLKNIPQEEAVDRLINLLKNDNVWHEPNNL